MHIFESLLQQSDTQAPAMSVNRQGNPHELPFSEARGLHIALASLRPPAESQQLPAWEQLQHRWQALTPSYQPRPPVPSHLTRQLQKSLTALGVQFEAQVELGTNTADAVLHPSDSGASKIILHFRKDTDFLRNAPHR